VLLKIQVLRNLDLGLLLHDRATSTSFAKKYSWLYDQIVEMKLKCGFVFKFQIFIDLNTCLLLNLKTLSQLSQKIRKHVFDVKCYSDSCVNFPTLAGTTYISITFKALVKLLKRKIKTVIMELIDSGLRFCLYFHDFHLLIINFAAFKQLFKNLE
jgi:hypothetical protein